MLKMNASPLVLLLIFCVGFNAVLPHFSAQKPSSIASKSIQEISEYESALSMLRSKRASNNSLTETVLQLKSLVSLANALILTEAVRNHTINVSSIVTDFMILEQLPKEHGWMDVLKAESVDPKDVEQVNKLFEELKPLQELIENAETRSIDVEVISNILNVLKGVEPAGQFLKHAKSLEKLIKNNSDLSLTFESQQNVEKYLKIMVRLSSAVDFILKSNLQIETIGNIPNALQLSEQTANLKLSNITAEALNQCSNYSAAAKKFSKSFLIETCFTTITEKIKTIGVETLDTVVYSVYFMEVFTLALDVLEVPNITAEMEVLGSQLSKFEKTGEVKYPSEFEEMEAVRMATSMNVLNSSTSSWGSIENLLRILKPILSIAQKISHHRNNSTPAISTTGILLADHFKSFTGFQNGIRSMKELSRGLNPSFVRDEISSSGINARSDLIKRWDSQIAPIPEKANGLNMVEYFLYALNEIKRVSNTTSDALKELNDYSNLSRKVQKIDKSFLNSTLSFIGFSINNGWIEILKTLKDTVESEASLSFSRSTAIFEKLTHLPDAIKFFSLIRSHFNTTLDDNSAEKEIQQSIEELISKLRENPASVRAIEELEKSWKKKENHQFDINKMIEAVKKVNLSAPGFGLVEPPLQNISQGMLEIRNYINIVNDLAKNEEEIKQFIKTFTPISELSNISSRTLEEKDVEATKELLKLLANPSKIDTVSDKFEVMAPMLSGSPFGNDILRNLSIGFLAFQKLVGGIESTDVLVASAREMKLEKLLKGVEIVQVVNSSFSSNSLEVLSSVSIITSRLDQLQKWIEGIDDQSRIAAVQKLKKLNGSDDVHHLHQFLSNLNKSTASSIGKLSGGLRKFENILLGCEKDPKKCEKQTSSNVENNRSFAGMQGSTNQSADSNIVVVVVVAVVAFICFAGSVATVTILLCRKWKKDSQDAHQKAEEAEKKRKETDGENVKLMTEKNTAVAEKNTAVAEKNEAVAEVEDKLVKVEAEKKEVKDKAEKAEEEAKEQKEARKKEKEKIEKLEMEKKALQETLEADRIRHEKEKIELRESYERTKNEMSDKMTLTLNQEMEKYEIIIKQLQEKEKEKKLIGETAQQAEARLRELEKQLKKNKDEYQEFVNFVRTQVPISRFEDNIYVSYLETLKDSHISKFYVSAALAQFNRIEPSPMDGTLDRGSKLLRYGERPLYRENRVRAFPSDVSDTPVTVHASFIEKNYIACQAPPDTDEAKLTFFEMLKHNNVKTVVQLCAFNPISQGKHKRQLAYVIYWMEKSCTLFKVSPKEIKKDKYIYEQEVTVTLHESGEEYTFTHIAFKDWNTNQVPDDMQPVIDLAIRINKLIQETQTPVVVHGLDGCGRTMTFIMLAHLMTLIDKGEPFHLCMKLSKARRERFGSVQTLIQFCFLDTALYVYWFSLLADKGEMQKKFDLIIKSYLKWKSIIMKKNGEVAHPLENLEPGREVKIKMRK